MGEEYWYHCEKCGTHISLMLGNGMMTFMPNSPVILEEIDKGEFGEEAKLLFHSSPEAVAYFEMKGYFCQCGSIESQDHIMIKIPNKRTFSLPHVCSKCGKRMRVIRNPGRIKCPKCGEFMDGFPGMLWD